MSQKRYLGMKCSDADVQALLTLRLRYPALGDSDLLRWGLHILAHFDPPPISAPPLPPGRARYEQKRAAEIAAALRQREAVR